MFSTVVLLIVCSEPRGFWLEDQNQIILESINEKSVQIAKQSIEAGASFSKIDLTDFYGATCA